jgi:hypothetical protein
MLIARLHEESDQKGRLELANTAVLRYLESETDPMNLRSAWEKSALMCRQSQDWVGEIHALVELSSQPDVAFAVISQAINRFNSIFSQQLIPNVTDERHVLGQRLATIFKVRDDEANATDCSRVAWLFLSLHNEDSAREYALKGIQMEPQNEHCRNLAIRLNLQGPLYMQQGQLG